MHRHDVVWSSDANGGRHFLKLKVDLGGGKKLNVCAAKATRITGMRDIQMVSTFGSQLNAFVA